REYLRAHGHFDHEIGGGGAGAVLAHAVRAALRLEVLGVAEVDQRIEAGHRLEYDVAAAAAVAAVRPTVLDIFLTPEADRPRAARTGLQEYLGLIEKVHFGLAS